MKKKKETTWITKQVNFEDLNISDIPNSKDSFVKQQGFILSLDPEYISKKGDKNSQNFWKKYRAKELDKITLEEIKTMLIGHLRACRHSGSEPDKKLLDDLYDLLKRELKNVKKKTTKK